MTIEDTWLDVLPSLPLAKAVPVVVVDPDPYYCGERGIVWGVRAPGETTVGPGAIVHFDYIEDGAECEQTILKIDLQEPQGWRYAVGLLMSRVANEDRARRDWPRAWSTACAIWEEWGLASGNAVTDRDRIRLAEALACVFPE